MQIAYMILTAMLSVTGFKRLKAKYKFSSYWLIWSFILAIVYLYYRIDGSVWTFTEVFNGYSFKAADIILPIPVYFSMGQLLSHRKRIQSCEEGKGFLYDDPIPIDELDDIHNRARFLEVLKNRILNSNSGESSFCIGVIGQWGSGKTTFIRALKHKLHTSDDVIKIDFDPWLRTEDVNLTEAFFTEFSLRLSTHTDLLKSDIEKYVQHLAKNQSSTIYSSVFQYLFPSINFNSSSLELLKRKINDALETIQKKVIVFIDDIDRLDQDETVEVLRLIRNAAGFRNVFYIVAFDKVQVQNCLKEKFDIGNDRYLEKIFQVEFYLTPFKESALLDDFVKKLKSRLVEDEGIILDKMFSAQEWPEPNYSWIGDHISHHRDIIRFLNLFDLHYRFVRKEIFIPDFISILVLRYKYPDFYYHLYKNRFDFLTFRGKESELYDDGVLVLKTKPQSVGLENTLLREKLNKGMDEFGIEAGDLGPLHILEHIFDPSHNPGYISELTRLRGEKNAHLSIVYNEYFSRYFDFSFDGMLSQSEFDKAINGSKTALFKKIDHWCKTNKKGREVIESLERIVEYPNFEVFDKVISALIHISNSEDNRKINLFADSKKFIKRFEKSSQNNWYILTRVFGTMEACKKYLTETFSQYCSVENWAYNTIAKAATLERGEFILSQREVITLLYSADRKFFSSNPKIDFDFRNYMVNFIRHGRSLGDYTVAKQIKEYLEKDMKETIKLFIGICPRHANEGTYKLYSDWINLIYEDQNQFIVAIKNYSSDYGQEIDDFLQKVSEQAPRDCVAYEFKSLPIAPADQY